jgi:putative endonuclease
MPENAFYHVGLSFTFLVHSQAAGEYCALPILDREISNLYDGFQEHQFYWDCLIHSQGVILKRNRIIGRRGEQNAAAYLVDSGYEVLARNVRTPHGEIDILARKEGLTIFVEVKTRTNQSLGPPEISITPRKLGHMIACADHYAQMHQLDHWQIDVISVEEVNGEPLIMHFKNAAS